MSRDQTWMSRENLRCRNYHGEEYKATNDKHQSWATTGRAFLQVSDLEQFRRHGGALVGLSPQTKHQAPSNWNMKPCKSVEFLWKFQC